MESHGSSVECYVSAVAGAGGWIQVRACVLRRCDVACTCFVLHASCILMARNISVVVY